MEEKSTRYDHIDNLKGLAIIIMIISHASVYLAPHETKDLYTTIVLIISRVCAPAFIFAYIFVLADIEFYFLKQFKRIIIGATSFSIVLFLLTKEPYSIHILWNFVFALILLNPLQKLSNKSLIIISPIIILIHGVLIEHFRGSFFLKIIAEHEFYNFDMGFPLLMTIPWIALAIVAKRKYKNEINWVAIHSNQYWLYLVISSVLMLIGIFNYQNWETMPLLYLMIILLGLLYKISFLKIPYVEKIISEFGKNPLFAYISHHIILLSLILLYSGKISYVEMGIQNEEIRLSIPMIFTMSLLLVGITYYLIKVKQLFINRVKLFN